jgi:hypothetical protein
MKSIKLIGLRTVSGLLLTICFIICSSEFLPNKKTNFTGTWVINLSKSDFGESPLYTAPKQLKIVQDYDNIEIERVVITASGLDSTMHEKVSLNGKPFEMITADQRTRVYKINWSKDEQILIEEYSSSYSGNASDVEYNTTEKWALTPDGLGLILDKQVKVANGYAYAIKAVYDKK